MLIVNVNGKPYKDFDAKQFFEKHKKGKDLELEVASEAGMETLKLEWTGEWTPRMYSLAVSKDAKEGQLALLEGWLKSGVGR
jgi:hypothetical protein